MCPTVLGRLPSAPNCLASTHLYNISKSLLTPDRNFEVFCLLSTVMMIHHVGFSPTREPALTGLLMRGTSRVPSEDVVAIPGNNHDPPKLGRTTKYSVLKEGSMTQGDCCCRHNILLLYNILRSIHHGQHSGDRRHVKTFRWPAGKRSRCQCKKITHTHAPALLTLLLAPVSGPLPRKEDHFIPGQSLELPRKGGMGDRKS